MTSNGSPRSGFMAFLDIFATLLVVAAAIAMLQAQSDRGAARQRPSTAKAAKPEPPLPTEPLSIEGAATRGANTAPAALIVYSDFQCPYCEKLALETMPALEREYVATGRLLVAFRHLPLIQIHPLALQSARYSYCAGKQGKFWPFHDVVFAGRRSISDTQLKSWLSEVGVSDTELTGCMGGEAIAAVDRDVAEAMRLEVRGTPTIFFGTRLPDGRVNVMKRLTGAVPIERLRTVIDPVVNVPQEPSKGSHP